MSNKKKPRMRAELSYELIEPDDGVPYLKCEIGSYDITKNSARKFGMIREKIRELGGKVHSYSNENEEYYHKVIFSVKHEGNIFELVGYMNKANIANVTNFNAIKQGLSDVNLRELYRKPKADISHKSTDAAQQEKGKDGDDIWHGVTFFNH